MNTESRPLIEYETISLVMLMRSIQEGRCDDVKLPGFTTLAEVVKAIKQELAARGSRPLTDEGD